MSYNPEEPIGYVECNLGHFHEVCPFCRQEPHNGMSYLTAPWGTRDSRVQVRICPDCMERLYSKLDTVKKIRAFLEE